MLERFVNSLGVVSSLGNMWIPPLCQLSGGEWVLGLASSAGQCLLPSGSGSACEGCALQTCAAASLHLCVSHDLFVCLLPLFRSPAKVGKSAFCWRG